jgi:hypothetical protein
MGSASGAAGEKTKTVCEESELLKKQHLLLLGRKKNESQSPGIDKGAHSGNTVISDEKEYSSNPTAGDRIDEKEDVLYYNDPVTCKHLDMEKRDLIVLWISSSKPENFPRDSFGRNFPMSVFLNIQ